jgi:hypothetical protein
VKGALPASAGGPAAVVHGAGVAVDDRQRRPRQVCIAFRAPQNTGRSIGHLAPGLCGNPVAKLLGQFGTLAKNG